jgi:hypothetical protein
MGLSEIETGGLNGSGSLCASECDGLSEYLRRKVRQPSLCLS